MQDAGNQDAPRFLQVKHHMLALLNAPQPDANFVAGATQPGIVSKEPATLFQLGDIAFGLGLAPSAESISSNVVQIVCGAARKAQPCDRS